MVALYLIRACETRSLGQKQPLKYSCYDANQLFHLPLFPLAFLTSVLDLHLAKSMKLALIAFIVVALALVAVEGRSSLRREELIYNALFSQGPSIESLFPTLFDNSRRTSDRLGLRADEHGGCEPGKTCRGLVTQIFYSTTCEWTETLAFVENLPDPLDEANGECVPGPPTTLSVKETFDNVTKWWTRSQYSNSRCAGEPILTNAYKTATCMVNIEGRAFVFWADAKLAHPLLGPAVLGAPINGSVPPIPDRNGECYDLPNPPEGYPTCDPRYPTWSDGGEQKPSDNPYCPPPSPERSPSSYMHGTALPNECYLDGFNTWAYSEKGGTAYTLVKGAGCNNDNLVTKLTYYYGCNWRYDKSFDQYESDYLKPGTLY